MLGDGRLGNLSAQVLKYHGCEVRVVGKHRFKLRIIQDLGIATVALDALGTARDADIVVDCTGSPSGLETALKIVRPCGSIVLKKALLCPNCHAYRFDESLVRVGKQAEILGSRDASSVTKDDYN